VSWKAMVINPVEGHTSGPFEALWYSEPYFKQIKEYLEGKGVSVSYLYKERAVRAEVWGKLSGSWHRYIVAVGHGGADVFTGYRLNKVFWVDMAGEGYSHLWTGGTVLLMLSCLTARRLGPYFTRHGAWSYLGWEKPFAFYVKLGVRKRGSWRESPDLLYHKPVEEAFARCAAGEYTPGQAYRHIYDRYTEYINNPDIPERWRSVLKYDRDHMKLLGNTGHPPPIPAPPLPALTLALGMIPVAVTLGAVAASELSKQRVPGVVW